MKTNHPAKRMPRIFVAMHNVGIFMRAASVNYTSAGFEIGPIAGNPKAVARIIFTPRAADDAAAFL